MAFEYFIYLYIPYDITNFSTFHHFSYHAMFHCADFHTGMKVAHSMAKQTRIPELRSSTIQQKVSRTIFLFLLHFLSSSFFLWLVLRLYPFVCPPTNRISTWNKKRVNTRSRLSEYMGVWHETKFQRQKLYHRWIAAMVYILCPLWNHSAGLFRRRWR